MPPELLDAPVAATPDIVPDLNEGDGNDFLSSINRLFAENDTPATTPQVLPGDPEPDPVATPDTPPSTLPDDQRTADDFLAEDDAVTGDWTPKAAARFKRLKAELLSARGELDQVRQTSREFESRVKELSGQLESGDLETLRSKVEAFEQKQMFTDLENTAVYKEAVAEPLQKVVKRAYEIADRYSVDREMLLDVLSLDDEAAQDEQISELFAGAGATDRDRAAIYKIIEEINPILDRKAELERNVSEALREAQLVEEERGRLQAAEVAKKREQASRVVMDRLKEKIPFLTSLEGLDLAAVESTVAKTDFSALDDVGHIYHAAAGKILPALLKDYSLLQKEIDVLTDRLAAFEQADPSFAAGGSPRESLSDDDIDFATSLERSIAGARR